MALIDGNLRRQIFEGLKADQMPMYRWSHCIDWEACTTSVSCDGQLVDTLCAEVKNAGISACEKGGEWQQALGLFLKMPDAKVGPDATTQPSACVSFNLTSLDANTDHF